jgi:hypothetical protein
MKKLILTLAAATSLTAGAALAQPGYYRHDDYRGDYRSDYRPDASADYRWMDARQTRLEQRINEGVRNGELNRWEARRARAAMRDIVHLEHVYMRDRYLAPDERADLDRRFDALAQQVRMDRADLDRDYGRSGYNNYRPPY